MHAARHTRAVRLPLGAVLAEVVLGASALVSVGADDLVSGFARGSIFARKAGAFVDVQLARVERAGGEARPADAVIPIHALPARQSTRGVSIVFLFFELLLYPLFQRRKSYLLNMDSSS